jgi:hypothetical protein
MQITNIRTCSLTGEELFTLDGITLIRILNSTSSDNCRGCYGDITSAVCDMMPLCANHLGYFIFRPLFFPTDTKATRSSLRRPR